MCQYYVFACTYSYITITLSNLTEWKSGYKDSYTVSSDHPGHLDPLMGIYRKVPDEQQNGNPVFKNVLSNFYMFYDGLYLILFILMYKAWKVCNSESGGYSNWMIGTDYRLSFGLVQSSKTGVEIQRQGWVVFNGGQWIKNETLTIIGKNLPD